MSSLLHQVSSLPTDVNSFRIDGALLPWLETLTEELFKLFPLPSGVEVIPETIPELRVRIVESDGLAVAADSPTAESGYITATLTRNDRISALDWYQDVRHLEFSFDHEIRYVGSHPSSML